MKRLFFVYIPVFYFSLYLIINGLRENVTEKEMVLSTQIEQLSDPEAEFGTCSWQLPVTFYIPEKNH